VSGGNNNTLALYSTDSLETDLRQDDFECLLQYRKQPYGVKIPPACGLLQQN
jgi:hypothetical protein